MRSVWNVRLKRCGCRLNASVGGLKKAQRAAEQDRPDVARARRDWQECQAQIDPRRLIFLDESGLKTNLTRLRGWILGGERLVEAVPAGHWETSTLVQAIDLNGTRAAMVLDGPMNAASFAGFCRWLLVPTLSPGDIVVMDNLSSHKSRESVAAIESAGAGIVYLPPYSPDLNPIELAFSKLKQLIRSLRPRTFSETIDAARDALLQLTHEDISSYFDHCGYEYT